MNVKLTEKFEGQQILLSNTYKSNNHTDNDKQKKAARIRKIEIYQLLN